jgi:hypothetical protein
LAYLIDYGFEVRINYNEITILKPDDNYFNFSWDSVKDYIIPFIEVLYDEYNYDKLWDRVVFYTYSSKYIPTSFDDIIADNVFTLTSDKQVINKIIIEKPKF